MRTATVGLLLAAARAQGPGNGVAKYTMSVSDPLAALTWCFDVAKFPLEDCRTAGAAGAQCNGTDTCGLVGRTALCRDAACEISPLPGPDPGFMWRPRGEPAGRLSNGLRQIAHRTNRGDAAAL